MRVILNHNDGSVFCVYKQGVYGHGVHAVTASAQSAIELSNLAASREPDNYHSFHVFQIPLNILPLTKRAGEVSEDIRRDSGWMNGASLYSVSKSAELKIHREDFSCDQIVGLTEPGFMSMMEMMDASIRDEISSQLSNSENLKLNPSIPNLNAPPLELPNGIPLVFLVYKRGNFGHGIHGASQDLNVAIELAIHAAKKDVDNYHSYEVYTVPMSILPDPKQLCSLDHGWMNRDPVVSCTLDGYSSYGSKRRPVVRRSELSDAERMHMEHMTAIQSKN